MFEGGSSAGVPNFGPRTGAKACIGCSGAVGINIGDGPMTLT